MLACMCNKYIAYSEISITKGAIYLIFLPTLILGNIVNCVNL